jgi:hypothetical protein
MFIVLVLVGISVLITIRKVIKLFTSPLQHNIGCMAGCHSCALKD